MELSVSQVAWFSNEDEQALDVLEIQEVQHWEAVPARINDTLMQRNIKIGAFQSLLFGTTGLDVFNEVSWPSFFDVLSNRFSVARSLQVVPLIFGSPLQRRVPGTMDRESAYSIATEFFRNVGMMAVRNSCVLLIEPNPTMYGCNFLTTHQDAADFVAHVESPGIGMHWDTGALLTEVDTDWGFIKDNIGKAAHIHASLPNLTCDYESHKPFFKSFIRVLGDKEYPHLLSVEMKPVNDGFVSIRRAISFFKELLANA